MAFCVVSKGTPDGIMVDSLDRVWVRTGAGLEIFASSGTPLAVVPVPRGSLELYRLLRVGSASMFVQSKLFRFDV